MNKFQLLLVLFLSITITSCSSDSEDNNMLPPQNNDITYTNTVKAIIDGRCLSCHSDPPVNDAPMPLTTFANVRDAVNGRGLITRVENGSMPPTGADLTDAQVQAIKDWQAGGFKN